MTTSRVTMTSNRAAVTASVQHEVARKLVAVGMEFRSTMLLNVLVGSRSGRQYRIPGTQRVYNASKPGEPPATRTGDLRRSYTVSAPEVTPRGGTIRVGSALPYAAHLEFGTSRVAERSHLKPTLPIARPALQAIFAGRWEI
jgi:putative lipase involved disintegration of autophagic bodies